MTKGKSIHAKRGEEYRRKVQRDMAEFLRVVVQTRGLLIEVASNFRFNSLEGKWDVPGKGVTVIRCFHCDRPQTPEKDDVHRKDCPIPKVEKLLGLDFREKGGRRR